jgi:hypothetical protein
VITLNIMCTYKKLIAIFCSSFPAAIFLVRGPISRSPTLIFVPSQGQSSPNTAQGITFLHAVLSIGDRDFTPGLDLANRWTGYCSRGVGYCENEERGS